MTVTRDLGYQYLWCDAYCINQEDKAHKTDQIRKMDQIYRGAELTIIATGASKHSGLPGVSSTRASGVESILFRGRTVVSTGPDPSFELYESIWSERAWTLQEGYLSKRLLVFTEHQMTFFCGTASWMEGLGGLECIERPGEVNWNAWDTRVLPLGVPAPTVDPDLSVNVSLVGQRFQEFVSLVGQHTRRHLTYDSDALSAFSGIMHFLQETAPRILNVRGLPYVPFGSEEATYREKMPLRGS